MDKAVLVMNIPESCVAERTPNMHIRLSRPYSYVFPKKNRD